MPYSLAPHGTSCITGKALGCLISLCLQIKKKEEKNQLTDTRGCYLKSHHPSAYTCTVRSSSNRSCSLFYFGHQIGKPERIVCTGEGQGKRRKRVSLINQGRKEKNAEKNQTKKGKNDAQKSDCPEN